MDKILILDFGGQSTQLIGRRIRQLGILSEIVPGDARLEALPMDGTRGHHPFRVGVFRVRTGSPRCRPAHL